MDLSKINELYTDNLKKYGIDPKSVGWTKPGSQQLRFRKLLEMIEYPREAFSLNELGCGYGELYKYCMENKFNLTEFIGYDISEQMLQAAKEYIGEKNIILLNKPKFETIADYSITSGIFNVRFEENEHRWEEYVKNTLLNMAQYSVKAFSFNLLTSYVDYKAEHLYYADPLMYFDFCKKNISRYVTLIHDYELYEWTILVKK